MSIKITGVAKSFGDFVALEGINLDIATPWLAAAIEDNIVADFPLCNKSFNCSYSGHDL